ncbi:oxidoreductase [Mycobacterium fragae]|uniref:Oxidoreductase n=2 Tax=Mycobacterium fragae TaxID=1260918 RepID=A0A1X1V4J7_9MYCO|nr:oxidoreductase [Mycobacterium fragae]ORV63919.1 oxidoreductase [Mycobacterium fragae]
MLVELWKRSRVYRMLRLGGYVAFDLPRTVTALGGLLLLGIVVAHLYVLTTQTALPAYFVVYAVVLIVGCLAAAGAMWLALNPHVPQLGWLLGDLISVVFLGLYLASRAASLPGLVALTGRWDVAPGSLAGAFALGFIAVHMSVLLGINVAYPQRQNWRD